MDPINGLARRQTWSAPSDDTAPEPHIEQGLTAEKSEKPLTPFKCHFPTDIFRVIVDLYVDDCRLKQDLRPMAAPARSCRLLYLWLEPEIFRFVPMKNVKLFTASVRTLKKAREYTKALDMSNIINPDYIQSSSVGPITLHPWFIFLEGRLEKLCVPEEYLASSSRASVFIRDVTVVHNSSMNVGGVRCERLRSVLHYENHIKKGTLIHLWNSADIVRRLPFNDTLWSSLHKQVRFFAFDLFFGGTFTITLGTIYDVYSRLKFMALRQCISIIYFPSQLVLEQFRRESEALTIPRPRNLQLVYMLVEEHETWTFKSLEWRGEDFWTKIQTRFESLS